MSLFFAQLSERSRRIALSNRDRNGAAQQFQIELLKVRVAGSLSARAGRNLCLPKRAVLVHQFMIRPHTDRENFPELCGEPLKLLLSRRIVPLRQDQDVLVRKAEGKERAPGLTEHGQYFLLHHREVRGVITR